MSLLASLENAWGLARSTIDNDMLFFNSLFICVQSGVYFGVSWFLGLAWERNWWQQYKIQRNKYPTTNQMRKTWRKIIFSHVIVQPLSLAFTWPMHTQLGVEKLLGLPFPPLTDILGQLVVYYFIESTLFYWIHRLLHENKFLYRHVHKQHHEFHVSTALAAEYAHPIESVFGNYLPFLAGPWIFPPHAVTYLLWLAFRILQTLDAHSGYKLPFSPWNYVPGGGSAHHDFHHSHPNSGCYGSFLWDSLMGTDADFQQWENSQKCSSA